MQKIQIEGHPVDEESVTMLQTLVDRRKGNDENNGSGALRTSTLSEAAGIEHNNSARHRLTNSLVPLGWAEIAGKDPTPGAARDATLWRATDDGETWVEEHTENINAPPAQDAARALARVKQIEKQVASFENELNSAASEAKLEKIREEVNEASKMAENANNTANEAASRNVSDHRLDTVENKAEKALTKAEKAQSSGPSRDDIVEIKNTAEGAISQADSVQQSVDNAATKQDIEDLRAQVRRVEKKLNIPGGPDIQQATLALAGGAFVTAVLSFFLTLI